jgi:hypothetical protein
MAATIAETLGNSPASVLAEGIVLKNRSGPHRVWIKVRNPASIAVQREWSGMLNRWSL